MVPLLVEEMPVTSRNGSLSRLFPTEVVIISYLIITGFLILVYHSRLQHIQRHLSFRIGMILVIYIISLRHKKNPSNKIIELVRFMLPFLMLVYLYPETDYLNNLFFRKNLDPFFSGLEYRIFSTQPALLFAAKLPSDTVAELMYFGYFSYYFMIFGIPLLIFYKKDMQLGNKVSFIIICAFLIYYLIFIIVPVGGPQFFFEKTDGPLPRGYLFGPLIHIIDKYGERPTAAFPSSHVGICMLLLWAAFRYYRKILPVLIPVSLLLILSTIYLRAHYIIDVIAAVGITPLMLFSTKRIYRKLNQLFAGEQILLLNNYEARDY